MLEARSVLLSGARAAALAAACLLATGCRTAWPAPPTEEDRAAFGAMAVVVDPEFDKGLDRPVTGWPRGLGFGAVRGIGAIFVFAWYGLEIAAQQRGSNDGDGLLAVCGVALGVAAAVVYFPFSMIGGAVTAADGEEIDLVEPTLRGAAEDPDLPAEFARLFTDEARYQAGRVFVPEEEAETVVRLRLEEVEGAASWNLWSVDRPFTVRIVASARVERRSDGAVIWEAVREDIPPGGPRTERRFVEWAEGDGALLRSEIDDALRRLARGLAWSIFVQRDRGELPPH